MTNNYPVSSGSAYRQWGHETFRAANITFDAGKFWILKNLIPWKLALRKKNWSYGRWMAALFHNDQLPRKIVLSNKLWLYDKEKGNPLAAWIKWKSRTNTFDTAIFSSTYRIISVDGMTVRSTMHPGLEIRRTSSYELRNTGFHITNKTVLFRKTKCGGWKWLGTRFCKQDRNSPMGITLYARMGK